MYFPFRKFHIFIPTSHRSVRLWPLFCYVLESFSSTGDPFNIICPCSFDSFSVRLLQSSRMSSCTSVHSKVVRNVSAGSCSAYGPTGGTYNMSRVVHHKRLGPDALLYLNMTDCALLHYIYQNKLYYFRNFISEVLRTKFLQHTLTSIEQKRAYCISLSGNPWDKQATRIGLSSRPSTGSRDMDRSQVVPKGPIWLGNGVRVLLLIHKLGEHLNSNPVYLNDYDNLLF
jgi:hypothetical protein